MTSGSALIVVLWMGSQPAVGQDAEPADPPVTVDATADAPPGDVSTVDGADPVGAADSEAKADADLDAVTERLLGDGPVLPAATRSPTSGPLLLPDTPSWMWPVGLLLLAAIVALRWQTQRPADASTRIRVIQRTVLGREGQLALIEVGEDDDRRRLLIGYGSGAPRLVAELDVPEFATASPRPEAPSAQPAAQRWQRALQRLGALAPSGSSTSAPRARVRPSEPDGDAGAPSTGAAAPEARLRPRRSLVAEVLAERGPAAEPPAAVQVGPAAPPPPVVNEEAMEDDPESKETYTFRGLIG